MTELTAEELNEAADMLSTDEVVVQSAQSVPDNAVNIDHPSEAPESAQTIVGPRGGLYYVPTPGQDNGEDNNPEMPDEYERNKPIGDSDAHPVEYERPEPEELDEYVEAVQQDPEWSEGKEAFEEAWEGGETTLSEHTDGDDWDLEREAMHQEIAEEMLNEDAASDEPVAVVLLGPPGAGKGWWQEQVEDGAYGDDFGGREFTHISSDETKEPLPEYNGTNAAYVHDEASKIAKEDVFPEAVEEQHNLMIDKVATTPDSTLKMLDVLEEQGYEARAAFVDVPTEKSAHNAVSRYYEEGRFTPLDYVTSAREKSLDSYETIIEEHDIPEERTGRFDNDVEWGNPPEPEEMGDELLQALELVYGEGLISQGDVGRHDGRGQRSGGGDGGGLLVGDSGKSTREVLSGLTQEALDFVKTRFNVKQEEWVPYKGPQGGEGWKNPATDEVVYDDEPPGEKAGEHSTDEPSTSVSPGDTVPVEAGWDVTVEEVNDDGTVIAEDGYRYEVDTGGDDDGPTSRDDFEEGDTVPGDHYDALNVGDKVRANIDGYAPIEGTIIETDAESTRFAEGSDILKVYTGDGYKGIGSDSHGDAELLEKEAGWEGLDATTLDPPESRVEPEPIDTSGSPSENREEALDQLSEVYDEETLDAVDDAYTAWSMKGYFADDTGPIWATARAMNGGEVPPELAEAVPEVSDEEKAAVADFIRVTRETLREEHGDSITVRRGIDQEVLDEYGVETEAGIQINPQALESWTTDPETAEGYGDVVLERSVDVDEVFSASVVGFDDSAHDSMQEITTGGDTYTIGEDNIVAQAGETTPPRPLPVSSVTWIEPDEERQTIQELGYAREEFESLVKMSDEWIPYQGPQGGEGWKNTATGDIVYDDEPPGSVAEEDSDPDAEGVGADTSTVPSGDLEKGDTILADGTEVDVHSVNTSHDPPRVVGKTEDGDVFHEPLEDAEVVDDGPGNWPGSGELVAPDIGGVSLDEVSEETGVTVYDSRASDEQREVLAAAMDRGTEAFDLETLASIDVKEPEYKPNAMGLATFGQNGDTVYINPESGIPEGSDYDAYEPGEAVTAASMLEDPDARRAYIPLHEMAHVAHANELRDQGIGRDLSGEDAKEWEDESHQEIAEGFTSQAAADPKELVADVAAAKALGLEPPEEIEELYQHYNGPEVKA